MAGQAGFSVAVHWVSVAAMIRAASLVAILLSLAPGHLLATDWVRGGSNPREPAWGIRGGLQWGIPGPGARAPGGPRGLIRLRAPILTNGGYQLINFIAIEPIVKGRRGFSELEHSELDGGPGKRLWVEERPRGRSNTTPASLAAGTLSRPSPGVEQLDVPVKVEPFENGASVRLLVSQRSDAPDEIKLTIRSEAGSAAMEYCILSATMGNMARTRLLWLKGETVSSLKLYAGHQGDDFAPHTVYPLDRLARTAQGDPVVAVTTDEDAPALVFPFPGRRRWYYGGCKVTQYWKKPHEEVHDDLHVAVNARSTYWKTQRALPGGVAFENFELRERFHEGQSFVFGITRKTPQDLGMRD